MPSLHPDFNHSVYATPFKISEYLHQNGWSSAGTNMWQTYNSQYANVSEYYTWCEALTIQQRIDADKPFLKNLSRQEIDTLIERLQKELMVRELER